MRCTACGFENPDGFAFCGKCGAPLSSGCPACGFQNPPGLAFCGKCGAPLESPPAEILALTDLDHLRSYLPPALVEGLQFDRLSPPPRLLEECTSHLSELLNTICSLLPTYVVEQVVRDPVPGRVGGRFVDGTLLFADISGFTSMSEHLSRIGREGAEEITTIVNRYFTTMLSILRDHDGQLVKFGGDALLGLFLKPDSTNRAVLAAQTMQTAMASFSQVDTSQGTFGLQMKAGVHRGRFFAARLGTAQDMEFALFGSDVNAAAVAESLATPGQILLDQATFEAITLPCQVNAGPSGHIVVTEIKAAVEAISSSRYLRFRVQVDDDRFAIQRTIVLYRTLDATTWSKAELVYDEDTGWATGVVDPVDSPVEYLAQAVDSTGNVALALDHGTPFRRMKAGVELPTVYLPILAKNYAGADHHLYLPAILR